MARHLKPTSLSDPDFTGSKDKNHKGGHKQTIDSTAGLVIRAFTTGPSMERFIKYEVKIRFVVFTSHGYKSSRSGINSRPLRRPLLLTTVNFNYKPNSV